MLALAGSACLSLSVGVRQALHHSSDFQWSGAHLLARHIDPWQTFLSGDPQRLILFGQWPNYLHELYVLLLPLGMLSFHSALRLWCAFNLLAAAAVLLLLARTLRLNRTQTIWTALLFLCCTPLRVTLANGQQGLLFLLLLTAAMAARSRISRGLWLGLSWFKYSFAPLLFLTWLFQRRWLVLACSLLPPLAGLGIAAVMLHALHLTDLFNLIREPLRAGNIATATGYGDLMTLFKALLQKHAHQSGYTLRLLLPYGLTLGLACACALWLALKKNLDAHLQMAVILALTLLLFPHLDYDYIVLVWPLAVVLRAAKSRAQILSLAVIGCLWYGQTIINRLGVRDSLMVLAVNALLLFMLAWALTRLRPAAD